MPLLLLERPHVAALVPRLAARARPHRAAARRASSCAWRRTRRRPSACSALGAAERRDASAISRPPRRRCRSTRRASPRLPPRCAGRPLWLAASTHEGEEEIVACGPSRAGARAARPPHHHRAAPSRARRRDRGDARKRAALTVARRSQRRADRRRDRHLSRRHAGRAGPVLPPRRDRLHRRLDRAQGRAQSARGGAARLRHPARARHEQLRRDGARARAPPARPSP